MSEQKFIDGVQEISINQGVVRVDMFTYSAEKRTENGDFAPEFEMRLLMSPEGFLQTFSAMERIVNRLIEQGAINRKGAEPAPEPSPEPTTAPGPAQPSSPVSRPQSPNF